MYCVGANVQLNRRLSSLRQEGNAWSVVSDDGVTACFDAVVLTIPVPQILQLNGDMQAILGMYLRIAIDSYYYNRIL